MQHSSEVIAEAERLAGPGAARDRVTAITVAIMQSHWRRVLAEAEREGDVSQVASAAKVLLLYDGIRRRIHREMGL